MIDLRCQHTKPKDGGSKVWVPKPSTHWVVEPKYNGWRVALHPNGHIISRHGNLLGTTQEPTYAFLDPFRAPNYIIDGELMGHRSKEHSLAFFAFDLMPLCSDLDFTFEIRRKVLCGLFDTHTTLNPIKPGEVWVAAQYPVDGVYNLYELLSFQPFLLGIENYLIYEGVVIKDLNRKYKHNDWIKFRFDQH